MSSLTPSEKVAAFRAATRDFARRYAGEIAAGMTDEQIAEALKSCFGIFSGSGGPNEFSITRQGAGLKLWVSHEVHNHVSMKPIWQGKATIAMTRQVYRISDPNDTQMSLL
ncbi:hypothetical protein FF098_017080 [Parvularcula flava]|uniref:Uncharacterized protein n=1 Tax=Aquisalinus luteolus TaxID=1566827 RepID=A0A8J3A6Q4_9PROT|nr:hypothetical protein [Aquisalinus luteolus]NHK29624.1 hypothetical protein [Aquisalinus luteolus]GGI02299.1 hypothetical protein GCM10011355_34980 [Aquisalinus luteolus]